MLPPGPTAPSGPPASVAVLRSFLRQDAPARERSVARWMALVAGLCLLAALALGPVISWRLSLRLAALLGAFSGWYALLLLQLSKGRYHPAVAWVNVLLETSIPVAILLVDDSVRGPEYALNAPPLVIWSALIMFSVLRASRGLCITAGAVAGLEYLLVYALVLHPQLRPGAPLDVSPPFIAVRAFLLLSAGLAGAILAGHLVKKAEEALQAVRAVDLLSKYFLHERLGTGGMAEVYRATYSPEGGFEKTVALKRVLAKFSNDTRFIELFKREARICSRLAHPNIVQVTDVGRFDGHYVLAMEYVEGLSLRQLLVRRGAPLPVAAACYVAAELASALDYLHRRSDEQGNPLNLVHRDVNPPNVLISRIGEVKLGDFGVAHAASDDQPSSVVGKPSYISPEQVRRSAIDGRADLFSLGLNLFEMLTGQRAIAGETAAQQMQAVFKPFPSCSSLRAEVPPELDQLVQELLAVEPERRPATGRQVRARLVSLQGAASPYPLGEQALVRCVEEAVSPRDRDAVTRLTRASEAFADPKTEPTLDGPDLDAHTRPPVCARGRGR